MDMVEAASPWVWHPLVIWASPSLWLDEGKCWLLRLMSTIRCMYSCNHICTNHQGPLTHDIFWPVCIWEIVWWSIWYTLPRRYFARGARWPVAKSVAIAMWFKVGSLVYHRRWIYTATCSGTPCIQLHPEGRLSCDSGYMTCIHFLSSLLSTLWSLCIGRDTWVLRYQGQSSCIHRPK
jgi:hypothetical protein